MNKYHLRFNVPLYAYDDKRMGMLQKVVINAETMCLTHLIVTLGNLFKKEFVLPLFLVESVESERIKISLNRDELINFPHYEELRIAAGVPQFEVEREMKDFERLKLMFVDHQPHADGALYVEERIVRHGVDPDDFLWSNKTAVHSQQGVAGDLYQVNVRPEDGRVRELVMRQGKRIEKYLVIPDELIERGSNAAIYLKLDDKEISELIEFFNYVPEPVL